MIIALMMVHGSGGAAQLAQEIRLLNAPLATLSAPLGFLGGVRELADGRLLLNDVRNRQLSVCDSSLRHLTLIVDSASHGDRTESYGTGPGILVPFAADSTLLIDPASRSMLVIDPLGKVVRVAAAPFSPALASTRHQAGTDRRGRIVYQGAFPRMRPNAAAMLKSPPPPPDSAPLVVYDLTTRHPDTVAILRIARNRVVGVHRDSTVRWRSQVDPLFAVDDWMVLSDGRLVLIRGRDYHLEWLSDDGSVTARTRLRFPWRRATDDEKVAIIDSLASDLMGQGVTGRQASLDDVAIIDGLPSADDLADYWPAFRSDAARADADGRLWIRTTIKNGIALGSVYDVIDSTGVLADRVQIPAGRGIVGFGRGGTVFMASRDGSATRIEKTRFH